MPARKSAIRARVQYTLLWAWVETLRTRAAKILIKNFHVWPAGASLFDEIAGFSQPHLAMQVQVGNGYCRGAIASGVTMQKEGVRLLGELVQDVQG